MKADIEEAIVSEGYGNTSEFFRDLVRGYLDKRRRAKLEQMLIEGLESGDPQPFTSETLSKCVFGRSND
ncbi:MAG: type II toxin-antitoxin system ParD family antitoxin [Blastocatellia bacterium]|nr:type II toxin-antitoxin system ParD family antitoxin [Blastocatellia bacterium]